MSDEQHAATDRPPVKDLLEAYWRGGVADAELKAAQDREMQAIHTRTEAVICGSCGSPRVRRDPVGDLVCDECNSRTRPPSSPDKPRCGKCGSGRIHTLPYADKKCRDCDHQWRPSGRYRR